MNIYRSVLFVDRPLWFEPIGFLIQIFQLFSLCLVLLLLHLIFTSGFLCRSRTPILFFASSCGDPEGVVPSSLFFFPFSSIYVITLLLPKCLPTKVPGSACWPIASTKQPWDTNNFGTPPPPHPPRCHPVQPFAGTMGFSLVSSFCHKAPFSVRPFDRQFSRLWARLPTLPVLFGTRSIFRRSPACSVLEAPPWAFQRRLVLFYLKAITVFLYYRVFGLLSGLRAKFPFNSPKFHAFLPFRPGKVAPVVASFSFRQSAWHQFCLIFDL